MAARNTGSQGHQDAVNLQVDIGVLKSQFTELQKQGDRQEAKIDAVKRAVDGLSTVSRNEFEEYKQHVDSTFVKTESIKGVKSVAWAIATALSVALVLALFRAFGDNL
jgi:hypothetical protein